MNPDSAKKQGTPNWADCATGDLAAAERFYAAVFGWTAERVASSDGSAYSIQRLDGKMVAGIYELNQTQRTMQVPPHWATYIEVDDVDAVIGRVVEQGGTVVEDPFDEPEAGRIAAIQDPVGAHVVLWHAEAGQGGEAFNTPGAMIWNELNTKEPARAAAFYQAVLGVEVQVMSDPMPYTVLNIGDRPVAGIMTTTPEMGDVPPSWDVYFASDDVDATVQRTIAAGGKALREPFDIPGVGRMAVLQDPQGAVFEVINMAASEG